MRSGKGRSWVETKQNKVENVCGPDKQPVTPHEPWDLRVPLNVHQLRAVDSVGVRLLGDVCGRAGPVSLNTGWCVLHHREG